MLHMLTISGALVAVCVCLAFLPKQRCVRSFVELRTPGSGAAGRAADEAESLDSIGRWDRWEVVARREMNASTPTID